MVKELTINGEGYPVKFGWNALDTYCELTNSTIGDMDMDVDKLQPRHIKSLIWAGLKEGARIDKKEFKITLNDVGDMMDAEPELMVKIMELFAESMPQDEGGNQPAPKKGQKN